MAVNFKPGKPSTKFAIVTGGSRGFGMGACKVLAIECGYTVYTCARSLDKMEAMAKEVESYGVGKVVPYKIDLDYNHANEYEIDAFVSAAFAEAEAKGGKVSLFVNSAFKGLQAMTPHLGKPMWEKDLLVWDANMDVGPRSCSLFCKSIIPKMIASGVPDGLLINVSSIGAYFYLFDLAYSVAHGTMDRFMYDLALELNSQESTNGTKGCKIRTISYCPCNGNTEISAFPDGETPIYGGRAIQALAETATADFLDMVNGKSIMTPELAQKRLSTDGCDGSIIWEGSCTTQLEANEVNDRRFEACKALPGLQRPCRGENDLSIPLPQMAHGFAIPEAAGFFHGYVVGGSHSMWKMAYKDP